MRIWQAVVAYRAMLAAAPPPPSEPDCPITATCRVCDYDYRCVPVPAKCGACGTDLPPSAPVGVELAALRVQEWLHREHDILCPVQEIEQAMRTPCSCPLTERSLAPPPAAARVDVRGLVAKLAAHVRPTCSELWYEAQAFLDAESAQTGKVSVYDLAVLDDAAETLDRLGDGSAGLRAARARIASALSQQTEPKPVLSEPDRIGLYQGPDDCPQLMVNDRPVAVFPAGSWAKVCDALDSITGSAQPEAKAEARGVVDEGSRSVTRQLLHWGGVPVHVTGTVTTSPGNWTLIDAALADQPQGDKR